MNTYARAILYMFGFELIVLVLSLEICVIAIYVLPYGLIASIASVLGITSVDVSIVIIIDAILEQREKLND